MRRIAFALSLLAAGIAGADEKPAAGTPPPPPKPAAELARLKPLEGTWICKGSAPAGSMGPGSPMVKYTSTFTVKPAFDGFAYTLAYEQKKGKEHPTHFSGSWFAGWDSTQKKLVFFWLDNMGSTGVQTAGDWAGDDLVLEGEGSLMGNKAQLRDTLSKTAKGLRWKGQLKPQGAPDWIVLGEDECTKGGAK